MSVLALVRAAKKDALLYIAHHKTMRQQDLYRLLAQCLRVAEICLADRGEAEALDGLFRDLPTPRTHNRFYVERQSDVYQRVIRYVFHGDAHRANLNRYAICLREAAKQDVVSGQLFNTLMMRGGVSQFFLNRPNLNTEISTRAMRFDTAVTHAKGAVVTLTLEHVAGTLYRVQSVAACA